MDSFKRNCNLLLGIFFILFAFSCEKKTEPIEEPNPIAEWHYNGWLNTYYQDYYPQSFDVFEEYDTFKCRFIVHVENDSVYFSQFRMDTIYNINTFLVSDSLGNNNTYLMSNLRPIAYIKWTHDSLFYFYSWAAPTGPQTKKESFKAALKN